MTTHKEAWDPAAKCIGIYSKIPKVDLESILTRASLTLCPHNRYLISYDPNIQLDTFYSSLRYIDRLCELYMSQLENNTLDKYILIMGHIKYRGLSLYGLGLSCYLGNDPNAMALAKAVSGSKKLFPLEVKLDYDFDKFLSGRETI